MLPRFSILFCICCACPFLTQLPCFRDGFPCDYCPEFTPSFICGLQHLFFILDLSSILFSEQSPLSHLWINLELSFCVPFIWLQSSELSLAKIAISTIKYLATTLVYILHAKSWVYIALRTKQYFKLSTSVALVLAVLAYPMPQWSRTIPSATCVLASHVMSSKTTSLSYKNLHWDLANFFTINSTNLWSISYKQYWCRSRQQAKAERGFLSLLGFPASIRIPKSNRIPNSVRILP